MFKKGYKMADEHKRKIGKANAISQLGKKHSEETKKKMSEVHKRNGTGKWNKGRKLLEETKRKMSESRKNSEVFQKAVRSKERSEKISKALTGMPQPWKVGEKCNFWQGGISYEPYGVDWTTTLKRAIRERDKYICRLCRELQGEEAHSIHHIDYDKKNNNPENLVTLCRKCHTKTNQNRDYWTNYFQNNDNRINMWKTIKKLLKRIVLSWNKAWEKIEKETPIRKTTDTE